MAGSTSTIGQPFRAAGRGAPALSDIAVSALPNPYGFSPLERIEGVGVRYAGAPEQLEGADLVPAGTKSARGPEMAA